MRVFVSILFVLCFLTTNSKCAFADLASASASAAAAAAAAAAGAGKPITLPCLDDAGVVKNADPTMVCKAVLPKCSVLHDKLIGQLKDMLEWKMYGYYYLGKDIKLDGLNGSTKDNPEGDPLPYPVCSVVGHQVANAKANVSVSTGIGDGEIEKQSIGQMKSCGDYPTIKNGGTTSYKTTIQYEGAEAGKKWFSYVLGAYPWEIRANAYDVIQQLKPDMSNLNEVIHSVKMKDSVQLTLDKIKGANDLLSADAKSTCNQTSSTIVADCLAGTMSITDPLQKLCTISKAQLALNETALPNMLVFEVMARTKVMHALNFGNIFDATNNASFKTLVDLCGKNQSIIDSVMKFINPVEETVKNMIQARKMYSCNASCLLDGNEYYTGDDWTSWRNDQDTTQNQRKCQKVALYNLDTGGPEVSKLNSIFTSESFSSPVFNPVGVITSYVMKNTAENTMSNIVTIKNPTYNSGFAGMIESIIRLQICPQKDNGKSGWNKCDAVGIKDKPAGK